MSVTNLKHGMRYSKEYSSWRAMLNRCRNERARDFHKYGASGIAVAPELTSFEAFFAHVGPRPHGTTLERIDTRKGYELGNVRWATPAEQARNRRSSKIWTVKGLTFASAQEAANHFEVSDTTIHRWVKGSYDARRGSFTPQQENCSAVQRY
jgi:hypothetical protein